MRREDRVRRGEQAAWLLEQDIFREAMDVCLVYCQTALFSTAGPDTANRELLYHQHQAIESIEAMLNNFVEDGQRAGKEDNGDE